MSRFGGMRPYEQSFSRRNREEDCPMNKFISRNPLDEKYAPNKGSGKYVSFFSYGGLQITRKQFLEAYKEVLESSLKNVEESLRKINKNKEEY